MGPIAVIPTFAAVTTDADPARPGASPYPKRTLVIAWRVG
jgi:hypothetical protein